MGAEKKQTHVATLLEVVDHLLLHVAQGVWRVGGDGREAGREVVVADCLERLLEGAVVRLYEIARAHARGDGGVFLRQGRGGGRLLLLVFILLLVLILDLLLLLLVLLRL